MSFTARPSPLVASLVAYKVPRHPAPIDLPLDSNEGEPPPESLLAAFAGAGRGVLGRYPSAVSLEAKLAARLGVDPACVAVTAGGDDAIDRLCRAVLGEGRGLVLPAPTFEMIGRYARLAGAAVTEVAWGDQGYPVADILARVDGQTGLVVCVSPNNPTGRVTSPAELSALCDGAEARGALVLVDLAYAEFGDDALERVALGRPNAVVIRTLSKAWGMAGVRVGYAAGPAEVIGWLRAAGAPYAVAAPSLWLAERWLDEGEGAMRAFVARVKVERAEAEARLAALGARVEPSGANFVFARVPDALWLRDALAGLGVGIRAFPGKPGLEDGVRITLPGAAGPLARLLAGAEAALRPEALLLDMDGVIADASGSYRRAIDETARSFGVELAPGEVAAEKRAGDANNDWVVTHRLVQRHGVAASFDEVKARFEALYQGEGGRPGFCEQEALLGEPGLLARLARRLPLAIVTGRPRGDAEKFLRRFGLAGLFRAVVTMEDAPLKPDPAPVRLALARLGLRSAWMVGDTPDDVRAARAAGVVPLGVVAPGDDVALTSQTLLRSGAARVLPDLGDLERLLGPGRPGGAER
jgi:histidinol-phosphate aminotransferase